MYYEDQARYICEKELDYFDDTELLITLSEVESIVSNHPGVETLWAGDFNYDLSRNNHFTRSVSSCLQRIGLEPLWKRNNIDYTHMHTDGKSTSSIDLHGQS